jgi:hypothetical protein
MMSGSSESSTRLRDIVEWEGTNVFKMYIVLLFFVLLIVIY